MLDCHIFYCYAECHYAESLHAECPYGQRHLNECHGVDCSFTVCHMRASLIYRNTVKRNYGKSHNIHHRQTSIKRTKPSPSFQL
jgi:hypothetical protein